MFEAQSAPEEFPQQPRVAAAGTPAAGDRADSGAGGTSGQDERDGQDEGRPVLGGVRAAVAALAAAAGEESWRLQEDELGWVLEGLDSLRRDVERVMVQVVGDAAHRGTPDREGYSSGADYVAGHSPSLDSAGAHQVVRVSAACRLDKHRPLARAVAAGEVPVRRADRVLRALEQIEPFLTFEQYVADQEIILPVAMTGTDRELRQVLRHLVECARPEQDSDDFEKAQRRGRGMYERAVAGDLTEFVLRLDPEGAAFVRAAVDPLAKPAPDGDGPDPRSPQQRRADAFLMILKRGMESPGQAGTTSNAKVIVTLSWEQLVGQLRGLGRTMTGDQLTPATVRRLACEADLIPVLLGTDGEVLDMGHRARLATPAQRRALWLEQQGCTYQGCSMPAQWCAAHHGVWWSRGGPTDHDNLYLLCPRHHTRVHDLDLKPVRTGDAADGELAWQP
jgi:hypothetical protein